MSRRCVTGLIHPDHLGTPQKMTDGSGAIVWSADYKPFGEATLTVLTITNNLRFPGQYYDAETGLNYNYYRDYNPVIGRYIEADPVGVNRGKNHLFVYVWNDPIRLTDPKGLEVQLCARQSWTELVGGKNSKFYVVPHCYVVVNGTSYSWHTEFTGGITVGDENPQKNSCSTMKCCPEKQAEFDACVKQSIEADIGNEGNAWFPALLDCCTWANQKVGKCWNKHCGCCKK